MSKTRSQNLSVSVRERLLHLSKEKREDFTLTLTRYAIERLLFRLAQSTHRDRFVLKGALLFAIWLERPHRPTRDLDLLAYGDSSATALKDHFRDICQFEVVDDGLFFDPTSIRIEPIREVQAYDGQRVRLSAHLAKARINLQVDIGCGDAVIPTETSIEYPTLLEFPAPRLQAYPPEAMIAEKLHAMVSLGFVNSRMKDFYDVWTLSKELPFDGNDLVHAIAATFARRQTDLPADLPLALTEGFAADNEKVTLWRAFVSRNRLDTGQIEFAQVIDDLRGFLRPPLTALATHATFDQKWPQGGPWRL